jgi:hypothetical protein
MKKQIITDLNARPRVISGKLGVVPDKKTETEEKRSKVMEMKNRLGLDVKKASDAVHVTKVAQRFGRSARLSSNRPKILGLKAEIEALRREKEALSAKRKVMVIEIVRNAQLNNALRAVRIDM